MKSKLQLTETSFGKVQVLPEAGMDFYLVSEEVYENGFIVRGGGQTIPIGDDQEIYSLFDLMAGELIWDDVEDVKRLEILSPSTIAGPKQIQLPSGPINIGAHPLLGKITLIQNTIFFRLISSSTDFRFDSTNNELKKDTYLIPNKDFRFINTGFGAVGRLSLPLPIPAIYVREYTIPSGTQLLVGTVAPQFGQSGGGVEVKTIYDVPGVSQIKHPDLPAY